MTYSSDGRRLLGTKFRVPRLSAFGRQRVLDAFEAVGEGSLILLVAPAGAGKTTAMAEFLARSGQRHAWYRAERTEADPQALLRHVEHALRGAIDDLPDGGWTDVDTAAAALAVPVDPPRTLLAIDDLHELRGTAGEEVVARLVRDLPDWLTMVAATRHLPACNLTALRLSGKVVDLAEDVLRWRPWEVERLFREFYRAPLRPEDAARLTQRTEGWAAGLQLFHLASQRLPLSHRGRLIDELHTRPGLVRDYLTRNVLAGLPGELRAFLIDTCVLGRLEARLCDELRGREDSAAFLDELDARRLFVLPCEDGRGYRYHEVLRSYLEVSLLERDGAMAVRALCQRAARLLEADGCKAEALHAYARAEAWDDVARLLGEEGSMLARGDSGVLLGGLPPALVAADPWLRLAQARALIGDGRLGEAAAAYEDAERGFGQAPAAQICRDELAALRPWMDSREYPTRILTDFLRAATRRDPRRVAAAVAETATAKGLLTASVAMLLAGAVDEATRLARRAGSAADAEVFVIAAARAVEHVAAMAAGQPADLADALWAAETLEQLGLVWLARAVRAIASCHSRSGVEEIGGAWDLLDPGVDPWGRPLLALMAGIASVVHGDPQVEWLEQAGVDFHALGATALEAWALAWGALAAARSGAPEPAAMATQARSLARSAGVPGAEAIAELAAAAAGDEQAAVARAVGLGDELGLALPHAAQPTPHTVARVGSRVSARLTCLGGLRLKFGGHELDLSRLKPQVRAALAIAAMHANMPVHREQLLVALWPDEDPVTATRKLQVLVSTLRRQLEPDADAGAWALLVRAGEAYTLQLPPDAYVDLQAFEGAVADARHARRQQNQQAAMAHLQAAFDAYGGELLPEFGPAEWVLAERERYRAQFVQVAQALASSCLVSGDPGAAVEVALAGLHVDRYRSVLWRLLSDAYRAVGDDAAAARADVGHAAVLAELGIPDDATVGSGTRSR